MREGSNINVKVKKCFTFYFFVVFKAGFMKEKNRLRDLSF